MLRLETEPSSMDSRFWSLSQVDVDISARLQRWTAAGSIALIAATWRLWIPQTVFPQIPLFSILCIAPAWCDWICLGCLLTGLIVLVAGISPRWNALGCILVLVSIPMLFSLDQHRLQPWAYQLTIFTTIWLLCRVKPRLKWMQWLQISIYFYSALGKFDFEFLHTVGQQMLGALTKIAGRDASDIDASLRLALVAAFPTTEFAIALGLVWPKTRRLAGIFAIYLHLVLIVILGPLGLNHRLGVLIWNALFGIQAYYLFVVKRIEVSNDRIVEQQRAPNTANGLVRSLQSLCRSLIVLVILLPCTERLGIWDHWPSWALYAPHSSRVSLEVAATSVHRLPTDLVALMNRPTTEAEEMLDWIKVPMDTWSLQSLNTPIYPQARFQLGVAQKIASIVEAEFQVRVTVLGTASRFTGRRQTNVYESKEQTIKAGDHYWFNCAPRRL